MSTGRFCEVGEWSLTVCLFCWVQFDFQATLFGRRLSYSHFLHSHGRTGGPEIRNKVDLRGTKVKVKV